MNEDFERDIVFRRHVQQRSLPILADPGFLITTEEYKPMTEQQWLISTNPIAMIDACRMGTLDRGGDKGWQFKHEINNRKKRLFKCACCRQLWPLLNEDTRHAVELAEKHADGLLSDNDLASACRKSQLSIQTKEEEWCTYKLFEAISEKRFSRHKLLVSYATQTALLREIIGNPFRKQSCGWTVVRSAGDMSTTALESGASEEEIWYGDWHINQTVFNLAVAIYEEQSGQICDHCVDGDIGCPTCEGAGYYYDPPYSLNRLKCQHCNEGLLPDKCKVCDGTGIIENGDLDLLQRFAILADALEDAGCCDQDILMHCRGWERCPCTAGLVHGMEELCGGQKWIKLSCQHVKGCQIIDLLLNK